MLSVVTGWNQGQVNILIQILIKTGFNVSVGFKTAYSICRKTIEPPQQLNMLPISLHD